MGHCSVVINYDALEVPFSDAIPADYDGVMGVPITFLQKYCPEQFEILGITLGKDSGYPMTGMYENPVQHNRDGSIQNGCAVNFRAAVRASEKSADSVYYTADGVDGYLLSLYPRILIREK
ncbi:adenine-specific methyltransferase EcoRI family protein [Dysosmobacter sp. Sow4_B12]|uniref:adenine-specific methyltransferase EcoRI family protein n=1 Tax=Dysosmobacter sp. Sow4_B12 TaxID=3438777 RepID=UPI003F93B5E7